jgi:hypothetical protein
LAAQQSAHQPQNDLSRRIVAPTVQNVFRRFVLNRSEQS